MADLVGLSRSWHRLESLSENVMKPFKVLNRGVIRNDFSFQRICFSRISMNASPELGISHHKQ